MLSLQQADSVVIWAPAKVNLYLEVLAKRADGYHAIETLMVAVSVYDTLTFTEEGSGEIQLECQRPDLSTGSDNLICRAAKLLQLHSSCSKGCRVRLTKRIPLAAGLAGGSTDAAATLVGLNLLWQLGLGQQELAELGAELGSDVPFFFATPAAWCTGRGEEVTRLSLNRPMVFVLVCLPVGLSTAQVYQGVRVPDRPNDGTKIRQALEIGNVAELGTLLHNRLQVPAEALSPQVADCRRRLESLNPAGCLMSGSGSSLFALCRDRAEAHRIAHSLRYGLEKDSKVSIVQSCS